MKAIICTKYGGAEVLKVTELPPPIPKKNEILIKIVATAVNSADVRIRGLHVKGFMKVLMRLFLGIKKPRKSILGNVLAGIVVKVGQEVTKFKIDDKVFGMTGFNFGTYAEYITVHQNSNIINMPKNATFSEAAAIVFGGQAAIHFLDKAEITNYTNPKILIVGATGSVGVAAIQIAKKYTTDITAICSTSGLQLMKQLGIHHVVYYDQQDIRKLTDKFDIIFDAVGKYKKKDFKKYLTKKGVYKSVSYGYASESIEQLQRLKEYFENNDMAAIIDKTYHMNNIIEAHEYVDTERKKGNVILKIAP